jgi:hypothetical protein
LEVTLDDLGANQERRDASDEEQREKGNIDMLLEERPACPVDSGLESTSPLLAGAAGCFVGRFLAPGCLASFFFTLASWPGIAWPASSPRPSWPAVPSWARSYSFPPRHIIADRARELRDQLRAIAHLRFARSPTCADPSGLVEISSGSAVSRSARHNITQCVTRDGQPHGGD